MKLRSPGADPNTAEKLKESSAQKKRKKRKGRAIVAKMSTQPEYQQERCSMSSPPPPPLASSTVTSHLVQNRRWPKLSRHKPRWPPTTLLSIIIIMQLLCDMASSRLLTSVSAASDPEPSQIRFQLDNVESGASGPRFLEEPSDTFALEGQREISLRCVILADRAVTPSWSKANRIIAFGNKSQGQKQVSATLRRLRPASPPAGANATSGPGAATGGHQLAASSDTHLESAHDNSVLAGADLALHQQNSSSPMIVYNYTLNIANVSLENEGQYQCGAGVSIQSQRVWLRVVRPPAKLEVFVRDADSELAELGSDPLDTPTPAQQASPIPLQADAVQQVVEVRHEALVRLECRASRARPRAELVWLDAATGRQLAPRQASAAAAAAASATNSPSPDETGVSVIETDDPSSTTEELIGANDESSTLIWTFRVRRDQHHLRVFTCRARHKAYELQGDDDPAARQPNARSSSVQLSVLYAPELEMVRDPPQAEEGAPLTLRCQAHARPPVHSYAWLVDGHLLAGAHEPELRVANLTRQLHMREIKCQANNSVGASSTSVWLSVKYAPAYVTHLMPASLQPDYYALAAEPSRGHLNKLTSGASTRNRDNNNNDDHLFEVAGPRSHQLDRAISRELAYGALEHEEVTLRCDFDAQPAPVQLEWFKIVTDYESLARVSPGEADDLIESGANHARFRSQVDGGVAPDYSTPTTVSYHHHRHHLDDHEDLNAGEPRRTSKRHIYPTSTTTSDHSLSVGEEQSPPVEARRHREELDFGLMSSELLHEMEQLTRRQRAHLADLRLRNASLLDAEVPRYVESLAQKRDPRSDQQHDISEPLALQVRHPDWRQHLAVRRQPNLMRLPGGSSSSVAGHAARPVATGDRPLELILADSPEQLAATSPLPGNQSNRPPAAPIVIVTRPRKAQVVSTQIRLPKFDVERVGRYVCKAVGAGHATQTAKSIFLVLRQRPRLVSTLNQFAPLGALTLQVECLAQVNTIHGNQSQIQWFKDGKLIDVMHKVVAPDGQREKSFSIVEQWSPDGLFMRSRLLVHGAEFNDFGKYNCTITNPLGQDSMIVELAPLAPTGFAFKPVAGMTMGLIFIFFTVVCLLVFLAPCRRLDSKLAHAKSSAALLKGKSVIVVATDTARHMGPNGLAAPIKSSAASSPPDKRAASYSTSSACSEQSSSRSSLRKSGAAGDELDGGSAMTQRADERKHHFVSAPLSACGQIHGQRRPESALSSAALNSTFGGGRVHSRASLRSHDQYQMPRSVLITRDHQRHSPGQHSPPNGGSPTKTRFAAIHESLESKLQFGSQAGAGDARDTPQVATVAGAEPGAASDGATELADAKQRVGLIGRIKSRFQSGDQQSGGARDKPARRSLGGSSAHKRPTISAPLNSRNSLSGSLTQVSQTTTGKHLMMAHLSGGGDSAQSHLISSSANLIQDSAASASDGGTSAATTSSGRSSSTSSHQHPHLHYAATHPPHMYPNLAYNPSDQSLGPMRAAEHYLDVHPQHQWAQHQHLQHQAPVMHHPSATMTPCDNANNLYANGGPYEYQPQLYANESSSSSSNPYGVLGGAASLQQVVAAADQYQQQQQQHYQMPLMMSEPYLAAAAAATAAASQQHQVPAPPPPLPPKEDDARPCYATVCGAVGPGQFSHQQHQQRQQLAPLNGFHGMMNGRHQPPIMVPTSDGGDAYFESNYGTLLSQSSAYKTLGYYPPQQQVNNSHCHESSSSSSTPNSLTTHANISNPPRLQTLKFTSPTGTTNLSQATSHQLVPLFHTENNNLELALAEQVEEEEEEREESQVAAAGGKTDVMNNDCQQQPTSAHSQANGSSSPHEAAHECQESIGPVNSTLDQQQQQRAVAGGGGGQGPMSELATNV